LRSLDERRRPLLEDLTLCCLDAREADDYQITSGDGTTQGLGVALVVSAKPPLPRREDGLLERSGGEPPYV